MVKRNIGEFIEEVCNKSTINNQYEVLTSSQDGIISQNEYFTKQIASKNNIGYKIVKKGEFTYRSMSDTGKFYINRSQEYDFGMVSPAYPVFKVVDNTLDANYLLKFFQSDNFQFQISQLSQGSTRLSLKLDKLKEIYIPIYSLEEQKQIVKIFESIDLLLENYRRNLRYIEQLIESRFNEMFGDVKTNIHNFKMKQMDQCCKFVGGSQPAKQYFEYEKTNENIRLIQIRDYKTDKYLTYIPKNMARRICSADDIMIGRYGPPIFQILGGIEGAYNVALMKAIPSEEFNKEYFRYVLKDKILLQYLESFSRRTAGQDGIEMDKLNVYPVLVPPIELQNKFVDFVAKISQIAEFNRNSIEKLEILKQSQMQKHFG